MKNKKDGGTRDGGKVLMIVGLIWGIVIAICSILGSSGLTRSLRNQVPEVMQALEFFVSILATVGLFFAPLLVIIGFVQHRHYKEMLNLRQDMNFAKDSNDKVEQALRLRNEEHYRWLGQVFNWLGIGAVALVVILFLAFRQSGGILGVIVFLFPAWIPLFAGLLCMTKVKNGRGMFVVELLFALMLTAVAIALSFA